MMINSTVQALFNKGFTEVETGGGCKAMVRQRDGKTDVVTDADGSWVPDANDWMFATYAGDWLRDADAELVDTLDHETSPMSLLEVVDL